MKKKIQLSKEFKSQATKAIISLMFFVLAYTFILALVVGLTVLCVTLSLQMIMARPMIIVILFGTGLASLGVLVLIFLLKFIFKTHKVDRSHLTEITKSQEPDLFKMIEDLVLEIGTSFPKKVYISADVNASVFYNSNFWSMFLPVKKNLEIGMGLVNVSTKEELRAILSHEFGHFSQRSMKIGTFVYNINKVIHNMLYDNESYYKFINGLVEMSGYFYIFVLIAGKINEGIQWILKKLYEVVNKSYMGLSKEMEFHADEIAASVAGYVPLQKSLLRMSIAENSFNNVLSFYFGKISENIKSENLFMEQRVVLALVAEENNLKITNDLPDISLDEQSKFDKSKLVIKDQWSSHPALKDRINRLTATGYSHENNSDAFANDVFSDAVKLQKQLTNKIFEEVRYNGKVRTISLATFVQEFTQTAHENSFSKIYNGYYDDKNLIYFDLKEQQTSDRAASFDELFSNQKVELVYTAISLQNDMEILMNISNNRIKIKTFDYDGVRMRKKDAKNLVEQLNLELQSVNKQIEKNDIQIFNFFENLENQKGTRGYLGKLYAESFEYDKELGANLEIYLNLKNDLHFVSIETPSEQIMANFEKIKPREQILKKEMEKLLKDELLTVDMNPEMRENLEKYVSKLWEYFGVTIYLDDNLNVLSSALGNYGFLITKKLFLLKKRILVYQEELMK